MKTRKSEARRVVHVPAGRHLLHREQHSSRGSVGGSASSVRVAGEREANDQGGDYAEFRSPPDSPSQCVAHRQCGANLAHRTPRGPFGPHGLGDVFSTAEVRSAPIRPLPLPPRPERPHAGARRARSGPRQGVSPEARLALGHAGHGESANAVGRLTYWSSNAIAGSDRIGRSQIAQGRRSDQFPARRSARAGLARCGACQGVGVAVRTEVAGVGLLSVTGPFGPLKATEKVPGWSGISAR